MKRQLVHIFSLPVLLLGLIGCGQKYEFGIPESSDNYPSTVLYNNKVDIIFIVDDSNSMDFHQKQVADAVPDWITNLNLLGMDYHIAVISTSVYGKDFRGKKFWGQPKFLTNRSPNIVADLSGRINMGSDGRDREAGLESLEEVLKPAYLNGEGQGFFRAEALLAIIAISNENDKSGPSDEYYANLLDQLKGKFDNGDKAWVFNFIGTLDTSSKCQTNPNQNFTERGDKFIALVKRSKGLQESICSKNLGPAVTNIRARIVQVLTDFKLSRKPDVSTIRVFQNGTPVPRSNVNGWDYIPDLNVVRFFGTWLPAANVAVRVDFTPATPD